jgi:hypothetical protein
MSINKKDVPAMMSAVGWVTSLVDGLYKDLISKGATAEQIHSLATSSGVLPIGIIGDALMNVIRQLKNFFQLVISGNRTTEEVVKAGKYNWSNDDVNSQNFPMRSERGHGKIEIIDFGREITSEEALVEAKKLGLERPDYEDALFFGEQFPEKQRERPIVFLHEPWQNPHRILHVLVLLGDSLRRKLDLVWFDDGWHRGCVFAFARKK